MTARARKLRADLFSNKMRSVLAIVSLAVGTTAVGGMHLAGSTVGSSFESNFLSADPPSAMLRTGPVTGELVDDVAAHPAVGEAEGRRLQLVRIADPAGDWVTVELVAMEDFGDNRVARIDPVEGAWPPADGDLVVERASLGELRAAVGDVVSLQLPDGSEAELPVTGTAFDVWEMTPALGGLARAYVSMETMADLTGSAHLDALYLRAADDPLDREQALAATAAVRDDVLAPAGVAIELSEIRDPSVHRAENAMTVVVSIMQVLSLAALVIAVVLVVNTVSALLAQQRRQLGAMKAIGATSGQLTVQYLGYVIALSLVALVVAVPASLAVGRLVAGFSAGLANFDLEPLGVPFRTIAIETAIAVLVPLAAVVIAVRRACRTTVQDAISERGLTAVAHGGRARLPVARPTVLAYRNAVRNRPRLALTVLTVALCGAVLVGVLGTGRSLDALGDQVAGYWDYDVEVVLAEPVALDDAVGALAGDEEVAGVEGWLRRQAFRIRPDGTENENISLTGAPPGSASLEPTLLEGRWFDADEDHPVVINTHLADEEPDLAVGAEVVLDIEGDRRPWTIVGVATTTLVGPVAYVPADVLAETIGEPGRADLLAVQCDDGPNPVSPPPRLDEAARAAGIPVAGVQTNADLRAYVDSLFSMVVGLLLVVGAVLAVVAIIGVAGTMTLGVVEQTREIGVLRTLGASTRSVRRLLVLQGLAIAASGALVGVVLSIPVTLLLGSVISSNLISAPLPAGFSWLGVAVWTGVALVIGVLGTTQPARVASRLTVSQTLAYE
jgi:putative ABC transport system permease protein